ncbi:MAG: phosphate acetyltransferase [Proteobacteria bacterium]|nr:phosphate acetyltransferase [Pseudomonadota bacterium]
MSNSLYITGTEARSGKSAIVLGVMELLLRKISKVGFFRPIIAGGQEKDNNIHLIATYFNIDIPYEKMYGMTAREVTDLASMGKPIEIIEKIIKKYNELKELCEFVVCDGTNYAASTAVYEFDINAEISKNLSSPVLLIANAAGKSVEEAVRAVEVALESLAVKNCQTLGTIVNRIDSDHSEAIRQILSKNDLMSGLLLSTIPDKPALGRPTLGEVARALGADVLWGEGDLSRHVHSFKIGAMQIQNLFSNVERGVLIITSGDRADILVACMAVVATTARKKISGIVLTGGIKPDESIMEMIKASPRMVPVLFVKEDTFQVARKINRLHTKISPTDERKITQLLALFDKSVDVDELEKKLITTQSRIITPKMFEYNLIQRARKHRQHVVLPEGEEERILRAAEILHNRDVVEISLLGNAHAIQEKIDVLGLRMGTVHIIDPEKSSVFNDYVQTYYDLRKHKGITPENARDMVKDVNFYATMMVFKGHADAMVSGAIHSTAETIRPALQIIRTKPGVSIVSSVFLMCLEDRVLVYGDCAVNPDPNAQELAEIALSSAQTAKTFGIEPIVALLSYSTGSSGTGADVDKVREATRIAKEMSKEFFPGLKIEGPIQYDAAVDMSVAKTKLPGSEVAGKATVFIFPDLNTGNNTYKAVQRSAGAVAIGPVLQGLKHPVNDLSRGCTVPDIVNTVAMTAIQAQSDKGM